MQNVVLYLIGFPGAGKLTTAKEICRLDPSFKLIDNHISADLIFCFSMEIDNPFNQFYRKKARSLQLEAIKHLAKPEDSFIFTNVLLTGENDWYEEIKELAEYRHSLFVPVVLMCDKDENKQRIALPSRREKCKVTDPAAVEECFNSGMIKFDHIHKQVIDNTPLTAMQTAEKILEITEHLNRGEK